MDLKVSPVEWSLPNEQVATHCRRTRICRWIDAGAGDSSCPRAGRWPQRTRNLLRDLRANEGLRNLRFNGVWKLRWLLTQATHDFKAGLRISRSSRPLLQAPFS